MEFNQDLLQTNFEGKERRAGFEFECAQLLPQEMADSVRSIYGGQVEAEHEFSFKVSGTPYGTFTIESDSQYLKEKKFEADFRKLPFAGSVTVADKLVGPSRVVVPNEIVTPPIPFSQLHTLDDLRADLYARIKEKWPTPSIAPCGLHINPELSEKSVDYLLRILRAFATVQDELIRTRRVSLLRRLWPYIEPYPEGYRQLLLNPYYEPDLRRFIDDYVRFNPTRNRALDLLPAFVWLDKDCLQPYKSLSTDLVKSRPTFHYRLPNCDLTNPNWRVADEWNSWAAVEKLASDPDRILAFMHAHPSKRESGEAFLL